jgi:hypothetical protein
MSRQIPGVDHFPYTQIYISLLIWKMGYLMLRSEGDYPSVFFFFVPINAGKGGKGGNLKEVI